MKLTKREKEIFYAKKVTPVVRKMLNDLYQVKYTWTEICNLSGIPQSRMSEVTRGNRAVYEKFLIPLIKGRVISMPDLKDRVELTDPEAEYLKSLETILLEDEGLRYMVLEIEKLKLPLEEVKEVLQEIISKKSTEGK